MKKIEKWMKKEREQEEEGCGQSFFSVYHDFFSVGKIFWVKYPFF